MGAGRSARGPVTVYIGVSRRRLRCGSATSGGTLAMMLAASWARGGKRQRLRHNIWELTQGPQLLCHHTHPPKESGL